LLQLLETSPEPERKLRARDRRWRDLVFERCRDAACVKTAYRRRVAELQAQVDQLLARTAGSDRLASPKPLDNAGVRQICEHAAAIASRSGWRSLAVAGSDVRPWPGRSATSPLAWQLSDADREKLAHAAGAPLDRPWTLYRLPLRAGAAPVRFVSFQVGGTCPSSSIYDIDRLLQAPAGQEAQDPRVAAEDENGNTGSGGEFFGADEAVIWLDHRYFVLTTWFETQARLTWIAPDGRQVPACDLSATQAGLVPVEGASLPVCKAVAQGSAKPLAWENLLPGDASPQEHADRANALFGWVPDGAEHLRVDLEGPRHSRDLVRSWHGGAGCGQDRYQLQERDATGRVVPLPDSWLPMVSVASPFDIYAVGGVDYLAVEAGGRRLLAFEAGRARTVCELEPSYQWKPSVFYDLREGRLGHRLAAP